MSGSCCNVAFPVLLLSCCKPHSRHSLHQIHSLSGKGQDFFPSSLDEPLCVQTFLSLYQKLSLSFSVWSMCCKTLLGSCCELTFLFLCWRHPDKDCILSVGCILRSPLVRVNLYTGEHSYSGEGVKKKKNYYTTCCRLVV